jgi:hypothetical protein
MIGKNGSPEHVRDMCRPATMGSGARRRWLEEPG